MAPSARPCAAPYAAAGADRSRSTGPAAAPGNLVRRLPLGQILQLGGFLVIIEQQIERNFQGPCQLFQRFDGWHGVPVLDAGDIAPEQPGPLFDFTLREPFGFAQSTETLADNHSVSDS